MNSKKKKSKKKLSDDADTAKEPQADYGNRVRISTLAKQEEESLFYTINFTPEQRMEYLYKLRRIIHGDDLTKAEEFFKKSKIKINKKDENS